MQLLPELAKVAGHVHLFQRSPNWVLPKEDTPFTAAEIARFIADRSAVEAERARHLERIGAGFAFVHADARALMEQAGLGNIAAVTDPDVRAKVTPATPWGCQRPLFSNDYYPALNLPHVELVTDEILCITPSGVVTTDGVERVVDTIVFATGYETTKFASAVEITGREGAALDAVWANGAQAYLGITVSGFPNLFQLYGPNTNHGSLIFMIECQVDYIVRTLQRMDSEGLAWVDVRPEVMGAYNEQLQRDLDEVTVWDAGCHQYYRGPSGRIVTQWPHSMYAYRDLTAAPDPSDAYEVGLETETISR